MPRKSALFIHHEPSSGKLSRNDTTKIWTHVSRRSWKGAPKESAVVRWSPEDTFPEQNEREIPGNQKIVAVSTTVVQEIYTSNVCLSYMRSPEELYMLEVMYGAISEQCLRVHYNDDPIRRSPELQIRIDEADTQLSLAEYAIEYGVDYLLSKNVKQAFACFETVARAFKKCLASDMIDGVEHILPKILSALAYAQQNHLNDVAQQFLQQVYALATISGGPKHPVAVCTKNVLTMGMNPKLIEDLIIYEGTKERDIQSSPPYTFKSVVMECKRKIRGDEYILSEAEDDFNEVIHLIQSQRHGRWRYKRQFRRCGMAETYLRYRCFDKAASLVSDAYSELQEYVDNGYTHSFDNPAPLSIMGVILQFNLLAQALAGQGNHAAATSTFDLAFSLADRYLRPGHVTRVNVCKMYAKHLVSQNRLIEAQQMECNVDFELAEFMLTP